MAFNKYPKLVARGLVNNRTTLRNRIRAGTFPPGRLLGPNDRVWTDEELDEHAANCPVEPKKAPPPPKTPRRKREPTAVLEAAEIPENIKI